MKSLASKFRTLFCTSTMVVASLACAIVLIAARPSASSPAPETAETLKQLENEFMKAALAHGSAGYMSYYADNAVELPNGAPSIEGKVNIAKIMNFLDDKNNQLMWSPVGADISASGDLGYTWGTFEFSMKGKDGKANVEKGKYTSIWKKQADGSWKVVLDMGNASAQSKQ